MSQCKMKTTKKPCGSCPWRLDQDARDIPGFDLQMAESLRACSPDERGFGPDFGARMFACHKSREGEEYPCAGWLAAVGGKHPMVRMCVSTGMLPATVLTPGEDWPPIHTSYGEVLDKLRASASGSEDA